MMMAEGEKRSGGGENLVLLSYYEYLVDSRMVGEK
jgi:hypothetical protein